MNLKGLLESLKKVESDKDSLENTKFKKTLTLIRDYLCGLFDISSEELALIMKDEDHFGHFVLPLPLLNKSNSFPLRKSTVTQEIFIKGRSQLSNDASKVTRLSIYETAKLSDKKPLPIQKYLVIPIKSKDIVFAVLWLSRRASNLKDAGKDFSDMDKDNLNHLMSIIAPFLYKSKPDKFV